MTSITGSLYNTTLNSYTSLSGINSDPDSDSDTQKASTTLAAGDTVSLSAGVATAQAREYYGLSATGNLTLSDFNAAAARQEETVSTLLAGAMESLGIPPDQQVSLSLDSNADISIAEDFTGKDELEELLNENETFFQAFAGLSTNNEVLDYVDSLTTMSFSLADYITADTGESDLLALASKYSTLKSAGTIEDLWRISRSETPYTYTYSENG